MRRFILFSIVLLSFGTIQPLFAVVQTANTDTVSYITIQGKIYDEAARKPLQFVTIAVKKMNVATVTNAEGYFILKIPGNPAGLTVDFSHVGYKNRSIGIAALLEDKDQVIVLDPVSYSLGNVVVRPTDPAGIVQMALERIAKNYGQTPVAMTAFYREFVKRNNNYISIAEAVVDIYKNSYTTLQSDVARIFKGRKSADVSKVDTVLFKYQGGISSMLWLDVLKNRYNGLLEGDVFADYFFGFEGVEMIDDKPHYVISFDQKPEIKDMLYRGKIYIEPNNLAIARVEFNGNVENHPEASASFIRHAPRGMKVTLQHVQYTINYREKDGRWYYNYGRIELKFKTNWKQFLWFKPTGTIISEMAVTDMTHDNVIPIPRKDAVKLNDIISDKLSVFSGDSFWESYNYIEPEQPIENAIKKMNRRLLRQGMLKDTEQE